MKNWGLNVRAASFVVGLTAVVISLFGCGYTQPDAKFLESEWHFQGTSVGMGTVAEFVRAIGNSQMTNGKHLEVAGWTKDDNVYVLHAKAKDSIELRFTHILASPSNGARSSLDSVKFDGQEFPPIQFFNLVIGSQAAQVKQETAPTPANAQQPVAASAAPVGQTEPSGKAQPVNQVEQEGPCKGLDLTVTSSQLECLDKKFEIADLSLNDSYKRVISGLDGDRKAALKKEQVVWIKEKESKCATAGADVGGQMALVVAADCKLQMTESRLAYLKNYK